MRCRLGLDLRNLLRDQSGGVVGDGFGAGGRRDTQSELGGSRAAIVVAGARNWGTKERHRGGHGEIALPFPRQEQLVWVGECSHSVDLVKGMREKTKREDR